MFYPKVKEIAASMKSNPSSVLKRLLERNKISECLNVLKKLEPSLHLESHFASYLRSRP